MSSANAIEPGSRDPTMEEMLREVFDALNRQKHVALPGIVQTYDAENNRADIQPALRDLVPTVDGFQLDEKLAVIPNVPIVFPRAGNYFITFPIKKGDMVTLLFHERSIEKWVAADRGQVVGPDDFRTHNLSDAVAIPGGYPFNAAVTEDGFDQHMVMGREGGSTIHIKENGEIHVGSLDAADFVALAQKVLDELNAVKTDFDAFKSTFDGHSHITTATVSVGPPGILAPPSTPIPPPHTPGSVAATKLKAD